MKVLMLSGDPNVLKESSEARLRLADYGNLFEELHIVAPASVPVRPSRTGNAFFYPAAGKSGFARLLAMWKEAKKTCKEFKPDAITVQSPDELGAIGFILARRYGARLQIQIHTDIMSPYFRKASWKEKIRYYLAEFLIPRADCLRVVSERIKRFLIADCRVPAAKIAVLPIFTDILKFLKAAPDPLAEKRFSGRGFKMIAVGRFVDKEKNFSLLIDVMADFVKICPDALLVLVGDGPDKENYRLRIANYKLEKNVIMEPWRNDLPRFYKSFDLCLVSSNYEGWGRTAVEAMAAGLPVLMTDVGLAGEVLKNGENGLVVPAGDKRAFLRALSELYGDPKKMKGFAEKGRETVNRLGPGTKNDYLALYKKSFEACGC